MTHTLAHITDLLDTLESDAIFCSDQGQAFFTISLGGDRHQTLPLQDPIIRDWFTHHYYDLHGEPPTDADLRQIIRTLRARAYCEAPRSPVALRTAAIPGDPALYLDIADATGDAIAITPQGWEIATTATPNFRSTRGQRPLPRPNAPNKTADLKPLRALLNCPDDRNWTRIQHWLLAALKPNGPYPVLILHGPPTTGKTTAARILRTLIDPVAAPLQALPTRERAIEKLAWRYHVLAFDHVTRMSNSATGALCRITSGTGIELKETNDPRDPLHLPLARPVIITTPRNGKNDWTPRADLAARAIPIEMPPIQNPRDPEALWNEFEAIRATLQSTLYTALAKYLARPANPPAPAKVQTEMEAASHRADPLFKQIRALAESKKQWTGTASELQALLSISETTPRALSQSLRDLAETLETEGVSIEFTRHRRGTRKITIGLRHPPP